MFFYIKIYAIINQKLINQKSLCILREYKSFRQLSRLADFVDSWNTIFLFMKNWTTSEPFYILLWKFCKENNYEI